MMKPRGRAGQPIRLRIVDGEEHPRDLRENMPQKMDGMRLLRGLANRSTHLAIFDPQYRSVLDKQAYGNEGERQKERAKLPSMTDRRIAQFVEEIERTLVPGGHMMLWVDKFLIGEGQHRKFFMYAPELKIVDLLCWHKCRPGMGRRFRCSSEYLIVAQKAPVKALGHWHDHALPDCWPEHGDRAVHAHAKPRVLTERLIRAVTKRGEIVVDPCAGSYGVLDACLASGRTFIGCDLLDP